MSEKEERGSSLLSPPLPPQEKKTPTALKAERHQPLAVHTTQQSIPDEATATVVNATTLPENSAITKGTFKQVLGRADHFKEGLSLSESFNAMAKSLPFATTPPLNMEGKDIFLPLSEEEYGRLSQPWQNAIICKPMGKSLSKEFLKQELCKKWGWTGLMEATAIGKGFYIIVCPSVEKKVEIIIGGPWCIAGSHIWVQPWVPGFKPSQVVITQKQIWAHLPELPVELLQREMLLKIGKAVGEVLKIDTNSIEGDKRRYASLCLWVDATKILPTGIWIGKIYQEVIYTDGAGFCSGCRNFGHYLKICSKATVGKTKEGQKSVTPHGDGGWLEIPNKNRREGLKNSKQTNFGKWVPKTDTKLLVNGKEERGRGKSVSDPNPFDVLCEIQQTCDAAFSSQTLDKTETLNDNSKRGVGEASTAKPSPENLPIENPPCASLSHPKNHS